MNRKNVSDATPPLHPTHKTGNLPFVKFSSIGDKVFETYSPIVKGEQAVSKKNPPPLARQKRNPWTKAEDDRLVALIHQESCKTVTTGKKELLLFGKIATLLNSGRNAKQCRDRWQNFLRDGIKKGAWTADEEDLIKDLYATFGAKWSVMAKLFKDRTDNDIKNKWYSMKRKDERNGTSGCKNPFATPNIYATPLKGEADYSSLDRYSTAPCLLPTTNLKSESPRYNDDGKVTPAAFDMQYTSDENVTSI